jgi:proline racemase
VLVRSTHHLSTIDVHTAGSPVRVLVGGLGPVPGASMAEKRRYLRTHRDDLRTMLMYEPRGHAGMSGSIVFESSNPQADIGIVFMEVSGWLPMCGHGTIGTVTALVESGIVPAVEPITEIVLEVPAGLIRASVTVSAGAVTSVTIANVASYLAEADVKLAVPGLGHVVLDVAYGGNFYAIVEAAQLGIELIPAQADRILAAAQAIRGVLDHELDPVHPETPWIHGVSHVLFAGPAHGHPLTARNTVFFGENGIARDPCGTGTSARMAQLYAQGQLGIGETFVHTGLIGTAYEGRVESIGRVGDHAAAMTSVTGRAYVTGTATFMLDPDDPLPAGFGIGYGSEIPGLAQ